MTCKHEHIQTWRFEDGAVAMWSCVECALKFEPITARADLEAENARLREALLDCKTNARKEGLVKRIVDLALKDTK